LDLELFLMIQARIQMIKLAALDKMQLRKKMKINELNLSVFHFRLFD